MKGKIYAIKSSLTNDVYVGSTMQSLSMRICGHRRDYKNYISGKKHYISSFEIMKHDDAYIELIEEVECLDKIELRKLEGGHIQRLDAINRCIAGRTYNEYYEKNKKEIIEHVKEYYQEHKEEIKEYKKKYREAHKEDIKKKKTLYEEKNRDYINKKRMERYYKQKVN